MLLGGSLDFFVSLQTETSPSVLMQRFLNIGGVLHDLSVPCVMAVLNVTPDSFFSSSRLEGEQQLAEAADRALAEGAALLDVGACSTRPGSPQPSAEEEWKRLEPALRLLRSRFPDSLLSVDTYRAEIARRAVTCYGVQLVNDVTGGEGDAGMFPTVADLHVPYVLTHMRGTPQTMQQLTDYDNLLADITDWLQRRIDRLHRLGVTDVIADPGFGLAKTTEQNWQLLAGLRCLQVLDVPLLAGLSRKSMIQQALSCTADEALNGTTAAHMVALREGASFLRVHDVRPAVEAIRIHLLTVPQPAVPPQYATL